MTLATDEIRELVLCPTAVELPAHHRVRLTRADPLFGPILTELATPGASYPPGTVCPAYADVAQKILAGGDGGWVAVEIPQDSCGHYDRGLLSLLARARARA